MITASKVGNLFACSVPFRPDVVSIPDEPNEAAQVGTEFHAMVEAYVMHGVVPTEGSARALRIFERFEAWWVASGSGSFRWRCEVPYAISLTTGRGRILPSNGQRDYSHATPDEVPGTVDLVALEPDVVIVWDIKTTLRPEYTDEPAINKQLLTLGLAVARAHNRDRAIGGLLFANEFDCRLESASFDALDLDLFEDKLRARALAIPTSDPTPGRHCKFCLVVDCDARPKAYPLRRSKAA